MQNSKFKDTISIDGITLNINQIKVCLRTLGTFLDERCLKILLIAEGVWVTKTEIIQQVNFDWSTDMDNIFSELRLRRILLTNLEKEYKTNRTVVSNISTLVKSLTDLTETNKAIKLLYKLFRSVDTTEKLNVLELVYNDGYSKNDFQTLKYYDGRCLYILSSLAASGILNKTRFNNDIVYTVNKAVLSTVMYFIINYGDIWN